MPGVLYGGDGDPVSVQMDARVFEHLLHSHAGEHALVQLDVEDKPELSTPALVKKPPGWLGTWKIRKVG